MTWKELETRLKKEGWELDRQTGSHRVFTHPSKEGIIVVSGHKGSDQIQKGMLHRIMKEAGWK